LNPSNDSVILSLRGVRKYFGGIKAVDDVTFDVAKARITGLIGPNGAGKTTLFNLITGYYRPDAGEIFSKGSGSTASPSTRPSARASAARSRSAASSSS